jgi:hypothetical protein
MELYWFCPLSQIGFTPEQGRSYAWVTQKFGSMVFISTRDFRSWTIKMGDAESYTHLRFFAFRGLDRQQIGGGGRWWDDSHLSRWNLRIGQVTRPMNAMLARYAPLLTLAAWFFDGCVTNSSSVPQPNLDGDDSAAVAEIYSANGNDSIPRSMIFTNAQGRITRILPCIMVGESLVCRKISKLTPAIGRLTELEHLTLDEVPSQDSLPAELWSLPNLTRLTMTSTPSAR